MRLLFKAARIRAGRGWLPAFCDKTHKPVHERRGCLHERLVNFWQHLTVSESGQEKIFPEPRGRCCCARLNRCVRTGDRFSGVGDVDEADEEEHGEEIEEPVFTAEFSAEYMDARRRR